MTGEGDQALHPLPEARGQLGAQCGVAVVEAGEFVAAARSSEELRGNGGGVSFTRSSLTRRAAVNSATRSASLRDSSR